MGERARAIGVEETVGIARDAVAVVGLVGELGEQAQDVDRARGVLAFLADQAESAGILQRRFDQGRDLGNGRLATAEPPCDPDAQSRQERDGIGGGAPFGGRFARLYHWR